MTEMSSAANVAAVGTTGFKAPGTTPQKTPRGYTPALAGVNFGVYLSLLTPVMVAMAFKIQHLDAANADRVMVRREIGPQFWVRRQSNRRAALLIRVQLLAKPPDCFSSLIREPQTRSLGRGNRSRSPVKP